MSDPHAVPAGRPGSSSADLIFARLLALLGGTILVLAAILLALPVLLAPPPIAWIVAYGLAALFGPIGFSLLGAAWRIRNRAVHGTDATPAQRRLAALLGAVMAGGGLLLVVWGLLAPGWIGRILGLVWGISLGISGTRLLLRSLISARS